jgi:hypothetical protein
MHGTQGKDDARTENHQQSGSHDAPFPSGLNARLSPTLGVLPSSPLIFPPIFEVTGHRLCLELSLRLPSLVAVLPIIGHARVA